MGLFVYQLNPHLPTICKHKKFYKYLIFKQLKQ